MLIPEVQSEADGIISLPWFPMPTDLRAGFQSPRMSLPRIEPELYGSWSDFHKTYFWQLFFALARAGGYLPFGS